MAKSKFTIQRGEGIQGTLEYDEWVLIGFTDGEDGSRGVAVQASRLGNEGEADMLDAVKTLSNAMEKSENSTSQVLGTIVNQTLTNGLQHLASMMEKDGD